MRLACLNGATGAPASVFTLDAADPLQSYLYGLPSATPPGWVETSAAADAGGATITLPAHSLVIVELPAPTAGI